jgi:hypothetical protein
MNRRTTRTGRALGAGLALALLLGLGLASAGPATAVATRGHAGVVSRHDAATTKAEQRRVENYWTPERMKAAVPYGVKRDLKGKPGGGSGGGTAVQETPQPRFGKVFFTEGHTNYVCSGTATNSGNGDVVTTAGHCVNAGPGAYVTNFAFVPAYNNGAAPYGTWTAQTLLTTDAWKNSGDFDYDAGFAVMNENAAGQSLTEVTGGGQPIAFKQPTGLTYKAYGYPAARPFDGQTLWSCSGTVVADTYGGSTDQGLACNMTGGSSGGGWITGGNLNSVTSFGYTGVKNILWGPYFGSVIQATYNAAATS